MLLLFWIHVTINVKVTTAPEFDFRITAVASWEFPYYAFLFSCENLLIFYFTVGDGRSETCSPPAPWVAAASFFFPLGRWGPQGLSARTWSDMWLLLDFCGEFSPLSKEAEHRTQRRGVLACGQRMNGRAPQQGFFSICTTMFELCFYSFFEDGMTPAWYWKEAWRTLVLHYLCHGDQVSLIFLIIGSSSILSFYVLCI